MHKIETFPMSQCFFLDFAKKSKNHKSRNECCISNFTSLLEKEALLASLAIFHQMLTDFCVLWFTPYGQGSLVIRESNVGPPAGLGNNCT